jgi:hypothetical protein
MRLFLLVFCSFLASFSLVAQTPSAGPELKNASLQERYQLMKSTSQTFQDYKVIKEIWLDKEWKIMIDSVRSGRARLREAKAESGKLASELLATQLTLKQREASMASTEHAASHINFAGIDFNKTAFTGLAIAVVAGLAALVVLIVGRLKMVSHELKEKTEAFNNLTQELEEHKHNALEKQVKLSRELQNERNRIQEMRGTKV